MAKTERRRVGRPRKSAADIDTQAPPRKLNLDRRVAQILAADAKADDDELLSSRDEAAWLGVSIQWLEAGRANGYGPPFIMIGPRMVRYRRGDTRAYLRKRSFTTISEVKHSTVMA